MLHQRQFNVWRSRVKLYPHVHHGVELEDTQDRRDRVERKRHQEVDETVAEQQGPKIRPGTAIRESV